MKSNKKIIFTFIILAVFLSVLSNLFSNVNINSFKSLSNIESHVQKNLKPADHWYLTGSPIFIDNNDPDYNWSKTATDSAWCSGSGTWNDPYLIENVTIDGQVSGSCIEIINSDENFIIKNCILYHSGSDLDKDGGITLMYVTNGKLIDNNCSYNNGNGIILKRECNKNSISGNIVNNNTGNGIKLSSWSNQNNITGNNISHNNVGIYLMNYCEHNLISDNIINNNDDKGINLHICHNNNISGNRVNTNGNSGISISSSSRINKIIGCIIYENEDSGIEVLGESWNISISGNTVTNNKYGIHLEDVYSNLIYRNNVSYNIDAGIYSIDCYEYTISKNNVHDNQYGIYLENSNITNVIKNNIYNNKFGLFLNDSNNNYIFKNDVCGNELAHVEEENCEGNIFKKNKCIKDPPKNDFPLATVVIIVISITCVIFVAGMYIFRKKSSRQKLISESILNPPELEDLRKTEAEVSVEKDYHVCIVHRGKIVGAMYSCPSCDTYYCMKCATVLKNKGEKCWACNSEIEL